MSNERPYGGESRAVRVGRRRQAFLDAALDIFGTVGFRKATVKTLCKQAQLADRYFYESFDTIEDLLAAAYEAQIGALRDQVLAAFAGAPPTASTLDVVEACLRAVFNGAKDERVARLIWLEVLGVSPRMDKLYGATLQGFAALLITLARTRQAPWHLPPETERVLGLSLVGGISECIQQWLVDDYRSDIDALIQANLIVFEGVILVLASRPAPDHPPLNAPGPPASARSLPPDHGGG
jgi:AcrR family transcriptional regulator